MSADIASFEQKVRLAVELLEQYPDNGSEMRIVYMDALINRGWHDLRIIGNSTLKRSILLAKRSAPIVDDNKIDRPLEESLVVLPVAASDHWSPNSLLDTLKTISDALNINIQTFSLWIAIVATDGTVVYYQITQPTSMSSECILPSLT
ncbi:tRNA intron endonuclease [Syncephalis fuscata]|nr:tRNA intron endonuclease [Syncephalis fuscata]